MKDLTPKEIVSELDKYIVGQENAKKSVAIALRNRWRRQQLSEDMREEVVPNNIILIGTTGVGKTEIARRLANLADAPFIKVEASKFTEVGYVGRDVESIVRDLMDIAVSMVQSEMKKTVTKEAENLANERLLDLLFPINGAASQKGDNPEVLERQLRTRDKLRNKLMAGKFEDKVVEINISNEGMPMMQIFGSVGLEEMGMNLQEMLGSSIPQKRKQRRTTVSEARRILAQEELSKLIDHDEAIREARSRVENSGIVFLDEIDKVVGGNAGSGPDVSREGVQRDILPIIEGSNVNTKYGVVRTDHVLFIAAGAFHASKPSDMIPELQGRFPIRVEMDNLNSEDFVKILTHPQNALIKQYCALLETEGVKLTFTKGAIDAIARIATEVNDSTENIGARRLHTIMTTLLEDILFEKSEVASESVSITKEMVVGRLSEIVQNQDLSRYIL
ncbi:MAG TPA: ATP-dependent protease ATPase subunit HslU [Candidatus Marinimicrobia bacterium]|nr:ATP-dependent protease ATPase subunit HslU [Candidatus Neomarinimicrobiota bacterium]HIB71110.1 ATP-dependent protease ATPase subunit HslU [Candidatus Neomarinimicrobiota bacterium]HIB95228.1 ATP-dependent protease ATPase subunit HslU [Candidatus Neomarinimicrobiota bacterium]HIC74593.1 ATP-dependent protease ATPase subunit HslU [Candidatus Neomarinimicrobiota bacterium]HIN62846.1 ATP-dependent protease ATPase subunit HslU [Candidatus Neomarinimicrobiota bacterium]